MDKWLNNPNIVRVVALILAILLWALVQLDQRPPSTNPNLQIPETSQRMINDVQITVEGLDPSTYAIVSMEPRHVNVGLRGPSASVNSISPLDGQSQVVIHLDGLGAGTHDHVPLTAVGFPDDVDVSLYPAHVKIVIEEVQQKELAVKVELTGEPAEGYRIGDPIIEPARVYVTLPMSRLDEVVAVQATMDVSGASDTIVEERKLTAVNAEGEAVEEVQITPSVVRVEVPVTSPFATVPLNVRLEGEPAEGYSVASFQPDTTEVTLFASEDTLNRYEFYGNVEVDISGLSMSRTLALPIPLEEGIHRVFPEQVRVRVDIVPSERQVFGPIPLTVAGGNIDAETVILAPSSGLIELELEGAPAQLDRLELADIQAIVDVSNLPPGEYTLPVRLNLPAFIRDGADEPMFVQVRISQPNGSSVPDDSSDEADDDVPASGSEEEAGGGHSGPGSGSGGVDEGVGQDNDAADNVESNEEEAGEHGSANDANDRPSRA